jgi:hypothetical protein
MNSALISDLQSIAGKAGIKILDAGERVELRILRHEFSILLVVPKSVLEFFIDVNDLDGKLLVQDWMDYAGYDATPEEQLAQEMRSEVMTFVERLIQRKLRLVRASRSSLEWQSGERWLQAVPFVPDTEQALPADARKASRG